MHVSQGAPLAQPHPLHFHTTCASLPSDVCIHKTKEKIHHHHHHLDRDQRLPIALLTTCASPRVSKSRLPAIVRNRLPWRSRPVTQHESGFANQHTCMAGKEAIWDSRAYKSTCLLRCLAALFSLWGGQRRLPCERDENGIRDSLVNVRTATYGLGAITTATATANRKTMEIPA
ncbi:hypothetical protein K504DRAFT_104648 [Pleomassaria siparia CBS 279.74]|uniref:Uncharacterized protein n=1 Tax=Pleomassaria siparia CBS 279.74 TaxID=1314801 RepID=A0A6G1JXI0_9PLEO|nr:hypothetical protein K504DRAFT_104648 [Pleomassaria siparia CBS 279.74]